MDMAEVAHFYLHPHHCVSLNQGCKLISTVLREEHPVAVTAPSIGRIVHYMLSSDDVEQIRAKRLEWATRYGHNLDAVTNQVSIGDIFPAIVVRVWEPDSPDSAINLRVMLDGCDDFWATSRVRGRAGDPGRWSWPAMTQILRQGIANAV